MARLGDGVRAGRDAAGSDPSEEAAQQPRPLVERVGLGAIALVLAGIFGAIAVAALSGGEVFLGTMAGIGALMTLWAATSTLRR